MTISLLLYVAAVDQGELHLWRALLYPVSCAEVHDGAKYYQGHS